MFVIVLLDTDIKLVDEPVRVSLVSNTGQNNDKSLTYY